MSTVSYPILHVDDDASVTSYVAALLRQNGIESTSLTDPTLTVETIVSENFRVVLLDIDMPGANGLDLLDEIKRRDGGVNVIMLTGLVSQATVLQSLRGGALACVFKPIIDTTELIDAIQLAYSNIERWWYTLRQLSELKHGELGMAALAAQGKR